MIRVKIYHANALFGCDVFIVESPTALTTGPHGEAIVTLPAQPERPHPHREGETLPALRSQQVIIPRGWTKAVIEDVE